MEKAFALKRASSAGENSSPSPDGRYLLELMEIRKQCGVPVRNLLELLETRYDYIICDTPPVSLVTDAAILSEYCDGVLLVVRQKYATFQQVKRAKQNLQNVHAQILGCVLNQYDVSKNVRESAGSAYYHYQYGDTKLASDGMMQ